ncbi:MAG: hypothetical protein QGG26_15490 [Candidatus Undinarchaeales archaeon]|nr:hypothetical protein [Candidatus Undinarchaeales archaeon]
MVEPEVTKDGIPAPEKVPAYAEKKDITPPLSGTPTPVKGEVVPEKEPSDAPSDNEPTDAPTVVIEEEEAPKGGFFAKIKGALGLDKKKDEEGPVEEEKIEEGPAEEKKDEDKESIPSTPGALPPAPPPPPRAGLKETGAPEKDVLKPTMPSAFPPPTPGTGLTGAPIPPFAIKKGEEKKDEAKPSGFPPPPPSIKKEEPLKPTVFPPPPPVSAPAPKPPEPMVDFTKPAAPFTASAPPPAFAPSATPTAPKPAAAPAPSPPIAPPVAVPAPMAPAKPAVISDPVAFHGKSMKIEGLDFPVVTDLASFAGKTLMLVKPTTPLTPEEVEAIVSKVQGGMGLLVVGDGGFDNTHLNPLAKKFSVEFNNDIISTVDQTGSTSYTPYMYAMPHPITSQIQYFQVDKSCSLKLGDWHKQVLLFSAKESFSDADWDGSWEQGEYVGSCSVMARYDAANCRVVFIGDGIMFERGSEQDLKLLDAVHKWLNREI